MGGTIRVSDHVPPAVKLFPSGVRAGRCDCSVGDLVLTDYHASTRVDLVKRIIGFPQILISRTHSAIDKAILFHVTLQDGMNIRVVLFREPEEVVDFVCVRFAHLLVREAAPKEVEGRAALKHARWVLAAIFCAQLSSLKTILSTYTARKDGYEREVDKLFALVVGVEV